MPLEAPARPAGAADARAADARAADARAADARAADARAADARAAMRVFEGVAAAPGISIGPAYLFSRGELDVEQRQIDHEEVEAEAARFEQAVDKAERDLAKIIAVAREKMGPESTEVFEAQRLMLRDAALYEAVLARIRQERTNADFAVAAVMAEHRKRLEAANSEYLRERAQDLMDVQERLLRHLRRGQILSSIDPDTVVVASNLTAADIVLFSRRGVLGCALDYGGATSHVSIMARALGVPAVVSLHDLSEMVRPGDEVILDGLTGRVILNPDESTRHFYQRRKERYQRLLQENKTLVPLSSVTRDAHPVQLLANLEFREEIGLIEEYGAEGVGLFRTEILFLMRGRISLSEDEQYNTYRRIVEAVGGRGTTFRVLDLGGDKMLPVAHREHNPFLGWRGIRVLLDKPDLLVPQLRAILRASAYGKARILVPMVTTLEEVHRFRAVLEDVKAELRQRNIPFDEQIPIGIMVEVPAVALMADRFAREVDFFSIGTNDLTQYTLAVDRGNDLVAQIYQELHPAVLSLIRDTVEAAGRYDIEVSVCGEMAADPRAVLLLVGLGVDALSMSPVFLPDVKRVIRALRYDEAQFIAQQACSASGPEAVHRLLEAWLSEHERELADLLALERPLPFRTGL